jgi:MerR family transcriptional regulator, copper efflux regulator
MAMDADSVSVGRAARDTGLSPKALRLYERLGIVTEVERTEGNYRVYDAAQMELLRFVRRARELGFGLDEIRRLVDLGRRGESACETVLDLLQRHAGETEQRIAELEDRRDALHGLLDRARRQATSGDSVRLCRLTDSR